MSHLRHIRATEANEIPSRAPYEPTRPMRHSKMCTRFSLLGQRFCDHCDLVDHCRTPLAWLNRQARRYPNLHTGHAI